MASPRRRRNGLGRVFSPITLALLWLAACLGAIIFIGLTRSPQARTDAWPIVVYATIVLCLAPVTVIAYWLDKRAARKYGWRLSEAMLHTLEALGGWPAAIFAQRLFRHKTVKVSYRVRFWIIVVLHIAAAAAWLVWTW